MSLARELWRLLDRPDRLWLVGFPLLAVLIGLSTLGGIAAVVPFFAVLADPGSIHRNAWLARAYVAFGSVGEREFLVELGAAFVAMLLLSNAISLLGFRAITRFAFRVGEQFHAALLDEYLHRDLLFHARSHGAQLINNTVYEVQRVATGVVRNTLNLASNAVTSAMIVAGAIAFDARIAAAAIVGVGGSYALAYLLVRRRIFANGRIESEQSAQRMRIVTESLGGIRDILLSGSQSGVLRRFSAACAAFARAAGSTLTIAHGPRHVIECVTGAGLVAAALVLTAPGGRSGDWLASIGFLGLAAYRLLPALQQIFAGIVQVRNDRTAFERIKSDLALGAARRRAPLVLVDRGEFRDAPRREIVLDGISFAYVPGGPQAVREVSVRLPARQMIGLVGANGAGKTTLADLVLGLLLPASGSISVDGAPLDDRNRAAWRAATAYVPQAIFLADTTIAENIANGATLEEVDWPKLQAVAGMARLEEFVAALPDGYRTRVGEHGVRLSGGQRQRLGIARALYRDASMLVLDEATSALDGLAERDVLGALESLRRRTTVLLIAHRPSSLSRCDLVIEMADGAVVGHGSFEHLMAGSEHLRRIAELERPLRRRS